MRPLVCLFLIAGISPAQVQNAADVNAGVYTTILAQGSLAVINYSQVTSTPVLSATVSLLPANSTTPIPAQVTGVKPFAISFVVPDGTPFGDAQLIYKPGSQATQWTRVTIVPANLSLFRTGSPGPLLAQNINPDGTPVPNGLASPAQPGQPVVLWGSGLGAIPQSAVQITLGGVAQMVLYAGAAPGQPGLNQINLRIVPGTPDGCYVPLTVTYGTQSLTSFLSKTSDGLPCHHPFQLSVSAMKLLDSGTSIQTGEIGLTTGIQAPSSDLASRQESAQVLGLYLNATNIANYFTAPPSAAQPCSSLTNGISANFLGGFDPSTLGAMKVQSATSTLTLPWTQPPQTDSPLTNLPSPSIPGGNWTWSTSGGAIVQASSFNFVLSPPVQIAGGSPLPLNRSQNQTIAWNGSGFDSSAMLQLSLTAPYPGSPVLMCRVPAQAGSLTLPANLLAQFNSGSASSVSVSVSETGPGIPYAQFNQVDGSPLLMIVSWGSTDARPVDFQ
ncbi:MAG TPA: hypothetical protein VGL82_20670 [Bryobacteraceae bacterium]